LGTPSSANTATAFSKIGKSDLLPPSTPTSGCAGAALRFADRVLVDLLDRVMNVQLR
jgi:hypothetical protein